METGIDINKRAEIMSLLPAFGRRVLLKDFNGNWYIGKRIKTDEKGEHFEIEGSNKDYLYIKEFEPKEYKWRYIIGWLKLPEEV